MPGIPPGSLSPKTSVNYILFKGTGTWSSGHGNKGIDVAFFGFYEDRHEPGSLGQTDPAKRDRYFLQVNNAQTGDLVDLIDVNGTPFTFSQVLDPSGIPVTSLDNDAVVIFHGNLQIHQTGCDKSPRPGQLHDARRALRWFGRSAGHGRAGCYALGRASARQPLGVIIGVSRALAVQVDDRADLSPHVCFEQILDGGDRRRSLPPAESPGAFAVARKITA